STSFLTTKYATTNPIPVKAVNTKIVLNKKLNNPLIRSTIIPPESFEQQVYLLVLVIYSLILLFLTIFFHYVLLFLIYFLQSYYNKLLILRFQNHILYVLL